MLSDQELEILKTIIRDNKMDVFSVLMSKKVFDDYKIPLSNGLNYYQFGTNLSEGLAERMGVALEKEDDEGLKKAITGLYHALCVVVQTPRLNE